MKKYIDRYIYAVTKRLDESVRAEVTEELKANIYDMLSEHPSNEEIENVLKSLGHPRVLASNYQDQKRHVISSVFYDDYINVLKIVGVIVVSVMIIFGTIDAIVNLEATNIFAQIGIVISKAISRAISGLITAFAWVTIIFWAIDHHALKEGECKWSIKDLPEVPKPSHAKISRTETIIELIISTVFMTIFIAVLMNYLSYIVISDESGVFVTDVFNQSVAQRFVPFFIVSLILGILTSLYKLYIGEWKVGVTAVYSAYEMLSASLFIIFINHPQLILPQVFDSIVEHTDFTLEQVQKGFSTGITVTTVVISLIVVLSITFNWYKTIKHMKKA